MLKLERPQFYKLTKNTDLKTVAAAFFLTESALIEENGLKAPPEAGEILAIPAPKGNLYTVCEGESKTLLCGSAENYDRLNGSLPPYPGKKVFLCSLDT